jgi:hypothetical protein
MIRWPLLTRMAPDRLGCSRQDRFAMRWPSRDGAIELLRLRVHQ